ncbi:hypothetical protein C7M71_000735 [Peterkaempfera bronchialis]|uniref:Uncharacterized protein n=1 Tax=Peterkaempfera bronchialis TaxID=2126346 RepID=A0A345SR65_9ACTN|nr:hypothetical protein C7M71_000735 [Peterkaempfera bronchialis]
MDAGPVGRGTRPGGAARGPLRLSGGGHPPGRFPFLLCHVDGLPGVRRGRAPRGGAARASGPGRRVTARLRHARPARGAAGSGVRMGRVARGVRARTWSCPEPGRTAVASAQDRPARLRVDPGSSAAARRER